LFDPGDRFVSEEVGESGWGEFGEGFTAALGLFFFGGGKIAVVAAGQTDEVVEPAMVGGGNPGRGPGASGR